MADTKSITINKLATILLKEGFEVKLEGLKISYKKFGMLNGNYVMYFRGCLDFRGRAIIRDDVNLIFAKYREFSDKLYSIDSSLEINYSPLEIDDIRAICEEETKIL